MKLTICILTIPERLYLLQDLLDELANQVYGKSVEILYLGDNLTNSVGHKRNTIKNASSGDYTAFIDDDDMITPDYIDSLLEAIKTSPDVVTFRVDKEYNDKKERFQVFQKIRTRVLCPTLRKELGRPVTTMPPNHLCCWRTQLIKSVDYPDKNKGEDHIWAEKMFTKYGKDMIVHDVPRVLYIYQYKTNVSRTQTR